MWFAAKTRLNMHSPMPHPAAAARIGWDIAFVEYFPSCLRGILAFVGHCLSWGTCPGGILAFIRLWAKWRAKEDEVAIRTESAQGAAARQITCYRRSTLDLYSALGFEISSQSQHPHRNMDKSTLQSIPQRYIFRDDQRQLYPTRLCTTCHEQLCKYVTWVRPYRTKDEKCHIV
jgi:hypothetical protein